MLLSVLSVLSPPSPSTELTPERAERAVERRQDVKSKVGDEVKGVWLGGLR